MTIGFIGAGKVGTSFGHYLKMKGLTISGYFSRQRQESELAAAYTDSQVFDSMPQVLSSCQLIGITTNDDQIENIAKQLAESLATSIPLNSSEKIQLPTIFHMSGSLSIDVLKALADVGCPCFTLHPLQSIASIEQGRAAFDTAYYAIETLDEASLIRSQVITDCLNGPVVSIKEGEKVRYHMAACMASNFLAGLIHEATLAMAGAGFTQKEGLAALMPLIEGTLGNIKAMGLERGLTGPIARGDVKTVQKHLSHIEGESTLTGVYKTMGQATLHLATKELLKDEKTISALEHLFREGEQA